MSASTLTIGQLGNAAGVNVETVRYYEKVGLIQPPPRSASGYRHYPAGVVHRLHFIRRGRELGFTIEEIRALLTLAHHPDEPCAQADLLARQHLAEVEAKIADLTRMRDELSKLAFCDGHAVHDCRLLDALSCHDDHCSVEAVSASPT
ncbi:helix-turn-helix domain-containing protein [Neisseriaceae bacterium JH1-16]|nr:helix-turn-helix domain-containing protein [Neisseriaceae bacterium JH1-16]